MRTLGALTVAFKLPWFVSSGHLLLGMSYFATLIYTAFRTRPDPSVVERGYVVRVPKAYPVYDTGYQDNIVVFASLVESKKA